MQTDYQFGELPELEEWFERHHGQPKPPAPPPAEPPEPPKPEPPEKTSIWDSIANLLLLSLIAAWCSLVLYGVYLAICKLF